MPLQQTSGNNTYDAYGGGVPVVYNYIEDVFSTWLYTGTGATQSIVNGINLSGKGGLVWLKPRSNVGNHTLVDTARGAGNWVYTNSAAGQSTNASYTVTAFNSNGFTLGLDNNGENAAGYTEVSWTFRKQPKFFDIVTYTGTGSATTIAHNLGSTPGCIFVKRTDATGGNWQVYHSGLTSASYYAVLNNNSQQFSDTTVWNATAPTSTVFSVGTSVNTNASGGTYVAYLFASNAGGFGVTGTDSVITCGSCASAATVNLGWEPQWVLFKQVTNAGNSWSIVDTMRGFTAPTPNGSGNSTVDLLTNNSNAELALNNCTLLPTGFKNQTSTGTTIYIAIRRGPMATPTDGTSVFTPTATTPTAGTTFTPNFVIDAILALSRNSGYENALQDRMRGFPTSDTFTPTLLTNSNAAQSNNYPIAYNVNNNIATYGTEFSTANAIFYNLKRAPGFFDIVYYAGNNTATNITHNLGVAPELIIVKNRYNTNNWAVGATTSGYGNVLYLNLTNAVAADSTIWNSTAPTSTVFTVGTSTDTNSAPYTYITYLFATCPGVSKVGTYTGNGSTQTINCGFTGGARFVLIKRTDSTGDWYVYDTARGMTTLTDPYLILNGTPNETATLGSVTTVSTGFALNAAILAAINTNAATYIFLAIA
jgi:hypothetical protein